MFRKLIHHRPFFRKPPFEDPRELGERYPKEPILTDYWIKPYILEALKNYPRLNDSCVVEGLWTFANSILLKNYKAAKRVPPTFDDPEVTHKIAFLDREDVELGAIKFWRKVDSTFGIDIKLGNAGISIVGDNDNPSVSLVNTPVNDGPKEIVNVEYLNQALVPLNDALNALANRVGSLEDLYENRIKPIITDPNGNTRAIHTTIHADASDANLPTCGAVYQYGKGISDALNSRIDTTNGRIDAINNRIDNLPSVVDGVQDGNMHPVTSNAVADELSSIRGTLSALSSSISSSGNGNNSSGSVETGGTYAGYRIWRSGNLAVVFIPGGDNLYNQAAISKPLPFAIEPITISSHVWGSSYIGAGYITGTYQGNGTYTIHLIENGTKLEVSYTGGGNSPGTGEFPATTIIGWVI